MLREINDRAAIEVLLREGPLTRAELELAIGLSKPATAQLLTRLEQDNLVMKAGVRGGGRGPRAQLWAANGSLAFVAAVDLTPHIADFVVADVAGIVLAEYRTPLPVHEGADVVGTFGEALQKVAGEAGITREQLAHVVIGAQGAFDPRTGLLSSAPHIPGWLGFDVPQKLSDDLGVDVLIENDVNLVAVEEMSVGQAQDVDDFVMVWLSEGVGGAVVIGRRLLRGATGGGGEIDWMRVPDPATVDTGDVWPEAGARFGNLVDSPAICRLAAAHGIQAETAWDAVTQAGQRHPSSRTSRGGSPGAWPTSSRSPTRSSCSSAATPAAPVARTSPRWCRKSCTNWSCRARPSAALRCRATPSAPVRCSPRWPPPVRTSSASSPPRSSGRAGPRSESHSARPRRPSRTPVPPRPQPSSPNR